MDTLVSVECRIKAVKVEAKDRVCAKNNAEFKVVAQACGNSANASGKICILPTGEHSVCDRRTRSGFSDYARFFGYVEPLSANFDGRTVKEQQLSVEDPCYIPWKPGVYNFEQPTFLNKGTWTVGSGNRYGSDAMGGESKWDTIGGGDLFPYSEHRRDRPLPCEVTGRQVMLMQCGDGSWHAYKTNTIRIIFHRDNIMATVYRDQASSDQAPLYQ